jgi:hypothetical protein
VLFLCTIFHIFITTITIYKLYHISLCW